MIFGLISDLLDGQKFKILKQFLMKIQRTAHQVRFSFIIDQNINRFHYNEVVLIKNIFNQSKITFKTHSKGTKEAKMLSNPMEGSNDYLLLLFLLFDYRKMIFSLRLDYFRENINSLATYLYLIILVMGGKICRPAANLAEQIQELQNQLRTIEGKHRDQITRLQVTVNHLQAQVKQSQGQVTKVSADLYQLKENIEKYKCRHTAFYNNPANTHQFFYTVANTGTTTAKLVHQAVSFQYYNFVNGVQIVPQQKVRYTIKAINIQEFPPMVGFCTSAGFGQIENQKQPQSAYYSYSGWLNEGGVASKIDVQAGVGDQVEMELDYENGSITWWKNSTKIYLIKIPTKMGGKVIYLSILMWQQGDELDLAVVPA